jgi:hypothetical protein
MASSSVLASDALAIPSLASSPTGLTNAGYVNLRRRLSGRSRDDTTKRATRTLWYARSFLASALSLQSISASGPAPVYGTFMSSSSAGTFGSWALSEKNVSHRLNTTSGLNASIRSNTALTSSKTASVSTSCSSFRRHPNTSASVGFSSSVRSVRTLNVSSGPTVRCTSKRTRIFTPTS